MNYILDNETIKKILLYFDENDPIKYLIHDQIEIEGVDKKDVIRYIPLLQEANYLHGFFVAIGEDTGKYAIGGLSPIGREAVRQYRLGNDLDIHNDY
jgi:hypothetical protein